uniref:Uncharacterized protein n=1 Tax=Peronospora matthiolae TaxID=2874970 RepID=A0AAV1TKP2_9STRA
MQEQRPLSRDANTATLQAFYARVINRVCDSYRKEGEALATETIARLQQKWQEKLLLYTGKPDNSSPRREDDDRIELVDSVEASGDSDNELSDGSSPPTSLSSSSSTESEAALEHEAIGRPSAALPSAATLTAPSVFSKMLGSKRRLCQLDGSVSDAEIDLDWRDVAAEEEEVNELKQGGQQESAETGATLSTKAQDSFNDAENDADGEAAGRRDDTVDEDARRTKCDEAVKIVVNFGDVDEDTPSSSMIVSSRLVSADDLAPVSGLSGISLPIQLAAEYSKFRHHGKRQGYRGQLHAIVLTWPNRLRAEETVRPGEVVWCYPDLLPGIIGEGKVGKMVSREDCRQEMKIRFDDGTEAIVSRDRTRRLSEYLIRKGRVHLSSEQ